MTHQFALKQDGDPEWGELVQVELSPGVFRRRIFLKRIEGPQPYLCVADVDSEMFPFGEYRLAAWPSITRLPKPTPDQLAELDARYARWGEDA